LSVKELNKNYSMSLEDLAKGVAEERLYCSSDTVTFTEFH